MMNIHIDILGGVVKVYSNSDFLFHFRAVYGSGSNVCQSCNMTGFCEKGIFGTHFNFRELVCQQLPAAQRPKVTIKEAEALSHGIRGKIIKKNLRK